MEIPAEALCKILHIRRSRYQEWERARMVVRQGKKCVELDAVEAGIVGLLIGKHIDKDDVRSVMEGIRPQLSQILEALPTRVRVICHLQDRTGGIVLGSDEEAVGRAVSTGWTVLVLDAGAEVDRVVRAFHLEATVRAAKGPTSPRPHVEQIRGK